MVNKNVKTVHISTNCGSDNVRIKVWIKPNNNNEIVDVIDKNNEYGWCDDCQHETIIKKVQMNANAKIIGFQVVGNDETSFEGDIHPMMDASFCVYNLSQARKMLNKDALEHWRLLTIWDGDIEIPTIMFSGDPRN